MREMKNSGFGYLDSIPFNWKTDKFKYHLKFRAEKNRGNSTVLSLYRELGVIPKDSRDDNHNVTSDDTSTYRFVRQGDFVINKMKAWQGSVAVSDYEGIVSPAYYVYEFLNDSYDKRYFHYLMRNKSYTVEFMRMSGGIRVGQWDLPREALENTIVLLPPLAEQKSIATYLDTKCAEIDALTADIQTQIDTLEQYKRSVVTEAVTKGLSPDAEMKDSGVQWIGNVPSTWIIDNPKYHFTQRKDRAKKGMTQLTASQKYGVITQTEYMELTGASIVTVQKDFDILKLVKAGDFVIHMRSFQGGLEYSEKTGSISSAYVMLIPNETIKEPRYYKWFFKSPIYIDALSSTSNLVRDGQAMRWANFIQLPIPIPPAEEQTQIADYLDAKVSEIDSIIDQKKEQLETLESYKKSLIYEYVTGKKEVPVAESDVISVILDPELVQAYITYKLGKDNEKGKVYNHKVKYLVDYHIGLGLNIAYTRDFRGPHDVNLDSYISNIVSKGWYRKQNKKGAEILVRGSNHTDFVNNHTDVFSQHESKINNLMKYLKALSRGQIERIATLYAVWNDLIIDGKANPTDEEIITEVVTNWTPNKNNFKHSTWQESLNQMKQHGIIPKGQGLHTITKA